MSFNEDVYNLRNEYMERKMDNQEEKINNHEEKIYEISNIILYLSIISFVVAFFLFVCLVICSNNSNVIDKLKEGREYNTCSVCGSKYEITK